MLYDVDEKIPDSVIGDSCRFSQIVNNLIGNAVKFTDKGSVIATLSYDAHHQQVCCEVKDTGIGIPESKRHAVFEKFIQGDATITRKYGGTGLGLAITKKLVVMLGGDINFESQVGVGSRFWFTMPVTAAETGGVQELQEERIFCNLRKKAEESNVLIAEDNPVNHFFLEKLLRKFGFRHIDITENGREAIKAVVTRSLPYDVIFMDCMMPETDGYEATRSIRKWEAEKAGSIQSLIIAMTANAMAGDKELCLSAGMDAYITKPLQPDLLKEALSEWFVFSTPQNPLLLETDRMYDKMPPLDMARLEIVAETAEEKEMIMGLFFRIQDDALGIMGHSRRSSESSSWKNAAHRLKGSAANLGMKKLAYLLEKAETNTSQSYDERTELLEEITREVGRVKHFISNSGV